MDGLILIRKGETGMKKFNLKGKVKMEQNNVNKKKVRIFVWFLCRERNLFYPGAGY